MGVNADSDLVDKPVNSPVKVQSTGISIEAKSDLIEIFNSLIGILEAINANVS